MEQSRYWLISLLLILSSAGFSQKIVPAQTEKISDPSRDKGSMTIQGQITDENGASIEGAVFTIKWTDYESLSDSYGTFKIFRAGNGDTVVVRHSSYASTIFVVDKSKSSYLITLKKDNNVSTKQNSESTKGWLGNILGKVNDENGKPLSNSTIIVKGTNNGTVTDTSGKFELLAVPIESQIVISHIGYSGQEIELKKSKSDYEINLKRSKIQLDEIVVVGYSGRPITLRDSAAGRSIQNRPAKELVVVEQNPEFPGGDKELYLYLAKNIRYPTEASKAKIVGRIIISFTINENGSIRNPVITQKVGSGIDEEVMRVVLNMPAWMPAKQNGRQVSMNYTLPVSFSLE